MLDSLNPFSRISLIENRRNAESCKYFEERKKKEFLNGIQ